MSINKTLSAPHLTPTQWVQSQLLGGCYGVDDFVPVVPQATAYAPANIALCKYWGKRDALFNLPITGSLSVSLGKKGTHTNLQVIDADQHQVWLNDTLLDHQSVFYKKLSDWLSLFLPAAIKLQVVTHNTVPTSAGLASSASGFAALSLACNTLFGWQLPLPKLSALARLGSGSASRSLWHGFVQWQQGQLSDGSDSLGKPLATQWPSLCVGVLIVDDAKKTVSSRLGMQRTLATSLLYEKWPQQVARDLPQIAQAIIEGDFNTLGRVSEENALAMHATMISASPALLYWQPESISAMQKIWQLREDGIDVFLTMDAGANVKLLFEEHSIADVMTLFPTLDVIRPFAS